MTEGNRSWDPTSGEESIDAILRRLHGSEPIEPEAQVIIRQALATYVEELRVTEEELRQSNEELLESRQVLERERQRYAELFALAPDGYVITDDLGVIREASARAAELFDTPLPQLAGKPLVVFVPVGEREAFRTQLSEALRTEVPTTFSLPIRTREGPVRSCETSVIAVRGPDGRRNELGWLIRDRTQQVRGVERSLAESASQLQAAEREGTERLRQAEKMEAMGRLAGAIAHDFNNVLMGVMGCSAAASRRLAAGNEAQPYLEAIQEAAERAGNLVQGLLDFSRSRPAVARPIRLNAVIRSSQALLHQALGETIALDLRLAPSGAPVMGDPVQLEQILMNLVMNARAAMPEGGTVTIQSNELESDGPGTPGWVEGAAGGVVLLSVSDTGVGMDEATRTRAFEPFFTTRPSGEGTGLGLASVYGIVTSLGGQVHLESKPGLGTTCQIVLPRATEAPVSEVAAPAERGVTTPKRGTALVVDDKPLVKLVVRDYLEDLGFEVFEAGAAHSAISLAESLEGVIDLLVTDVIMSGTGGPELARELRRTRPDLKVLYISAYPRDLLIQQGRLDASDPLVQKPFTQSSLEAEIEAIL